jgi:hypothetical protein
MGLDLLAIPPAELVALVVATSFAAGLSVPATVATIGLLARAGAVELPPALDPVASWWVIGAAAALFVVEFIADKTPVIDLIWNALQTFIRVPAGALIAYAATTQLSPGQQLLAALLGGVVALAAHSAKAAVHATVNASPEPFSNAAVGAVEDAFAIFLTWFATQYPFIAAAIAIGFLVAIVILIRVVWRALRGLFRRFNPQSGRGLRRHTAPPL